MDKGGISGGKYIQTQQTQLRGHPIKAPIETWAIHGARSKHSVEQNDQIRRWWPFLWDWSGVLLPEWGGPLNSLCQWCVGLCNTGHWSHSSSQRADSITHRPRESLEIQFSFMWKEQEAVIANHLLWFSSYIEIAILMKRCLTWTLNQAYLDINPDSAS